VVDGAGIVQAASCVWVVFAACFAGANPGIVVVVVAGVHAFTEVAPSSSTVHRAKIEIQEEAIGVPFDWVVDIFGIVFER